MRKNSKDRDENFPVSFDLPGLGWELFSMSGNVGYYMLYHDLIRDQYEEDERKKFD